MYQFVCVSHGLSPTGQGYSPNISQGQEEDGGRVRPPFLAMFRRSRIIIAESLLRPPAHQQIVRDVAEDLPVLPMRESQRDAMLVRLPTVVIGPAPCDVLLRRPLCEMCQGP